MTPQRLAGAAAFVTSLLTPAFGAIAGAVVFAPVNGVIVLYGAVFAALFAPLSTIVAAIAYGLLGWRLRVAGSSDATGRLASTGLGMVLGPALAIPAVGLILAMPLGIGRLLILGLVASAVGGLGGTVVWSLERYAGAPLPSDAPRLRE